MKVVDFVRDTIHRLSGEEPEIDAVTDSSGMVIKIQVKGNIPAVIGRQGKTIDAIRVIAKAIGVDKTKSHKIKVVISGK